MPKRIPEGYSCLKLHRGPVSPGGVCIPCRREKERAYRQTDAYKLKKARNDRARLQRLKVRVFTHYSGGSPRCACCGETHLAFLVLDHTEDNGAEHRRQVQAERMPGITSLASGWGMYLWLERKGFPEGFQVLCCNCNHAKSYWLGGCPHQQAA